MASSAQPAVGFNLLAITLILTIAGLSVAYGVGILESRDFGGDAEDSVVTSNLGGRPLTIPAAWLPDGATDSDDFASRIDLRVELPLGPDGTLAPIDVLLVPRSQARPSAALLDGVYLHMFEAEELSGPPGLIGKPLKAQEGYAGETVWYDPISPQPFVAKCIAPIENGGDSWCLRTVALAKGIAATYRFSATLLPQWHSFDTQMNPLLARIGAL
jgi:F0F1-type ATP synthase membrane subunit c/vacuolar-type H+-ATPase subunit K